MKRSLLGSPAPKKEKALREAELKKTLEDMKTTAHRVAKKTRKWFRKKLVIKS
jgi:tRNA A37 N6-isopentenylltransferase MiaA